MTGADVQSTIDSVANSPVISGVLPVTTGAPIVTPQVNPTGAITPIAIIQQSRSVDAGTFSVATFEEAGHSLVASTFTFGMMLLISLAF